jgi:hypothetical protein
VDLSQASSHEQPLPRFLYLPRQKLPHLLIILPR